MSSKVKKSYKKHIRNLKCKKTKKCIKHYNKTRKNKYKMYGG